MWKKLTIEYVREKYEEKGCILKSTEYVDSKTKLDYICKMGHEHSITWGDFKSGRGCPICGTESRVAKRRLDFSDVIKSFAAERYVVVSDTYINVDQILDLICKNGHSCRISYHNWKSGWRCIKCRDERCSIRMSGEKHPNWKGGASLDQYCEVWKDKEYMNDIFERDNYTCQNPYCFNNRSDDLVRHHIEYDKTKCAPKDIITLCRVCHGYSGYNREWHELYFQTLMNHKHGYIYV